MSQKRAFWASDVQLLCLGPCICRSHIQVCLAHQAAHRAALAHHDAGRGEEGEKESTLHFAEVQAPTWHYSCFFSLTPTAPM